MTQPMQIQSAVIPAFEPESMKVVDAGCVKAGSRVITSDLAGVVCQPSRMASCSIMPGMTQRGFSLVSAIFLLVVIAALGTFAVTLSTTQHQSEAMDVMGKRAYQAARAGIEWGAFQIIQSGVSPAFATACQSISGISAPLAVAAPLSAFSVNVECRTGGAPFVDGAPVWVYTVSSVANTTGVASGNPDYIERQLSVTIAQ